MGFLDKVMGGNKQTRYVITETGHQEADKMAGGEGWRCIFLSHIIDAAPASVSVSEMSEKTGCDLHKTKVRLDILCNEQLLKKTKGD